MNPEKTAVTAFLVMLSLLCAGLVTAAERSAVVESKSSITYPASDEKYSITFVFDKPYPCGQYANGDWWVAVDSKTKEVVIKQITPAAENGINGWTVNPVMKDKTGDPLGRYETQPFDKRARLKYDPSEMPALPYSAHGGESIVKVASRAEVYRGWMWCEFAAVLTVVDQPVGNSNATFRPPYAGTYKPVFKTTDLQTNLLPSLKSPAHPITQVEAEKRTKNVRIDYSTNQFLVESAMGIECAPAWGTDMSREDGEVFLWLCLDQPIEEKRKALIGMVQYGIDLYGARKSLGTKWPYGGGGNGQGRIMPFTFAAVMLNSPEIKEELQKCVTGAKWDNTFWESEMFYRGNDGRVLWGQWTPWMPEDVYWKGLAVDPNINKAERDFYHLIDGGSIPGEQYQGCTCMPVVYQALILHLIPKLREAWPEKDILILEYADRWVTRGVRTMPDPYAPAPKLTEEEWKEKEKHGYGKTWGPDPEHPGEAIKGPGRFQERHGKFVNGEGLGGAERRSEFGDEMWKMYRGEILNK